MRSQLITFIALILAAAFWCYGAAQSEDDGSRSSIRYDRHGAVTSLSHPEKGRTVHLVFTADSMFEGAPFALDVMRLKGVKGSFFLTGNFLRDSLRNGETIRRIIAEGHYLGPHGDRHILLADWDAARTTLASPDSALADMHANMEWLARYGIDPLKARFIIPSFEWYNHNHISAFRSAGYVPVTPSPGFLTYRDYTTPDMEDYYSNDTIWNNFIENVTNHNIDGCFILIHLGTLDIRKEKFYRLLPQLLDTLSANGYTPVSL